MCIEGNNTGHVFRQKIIENKFFNRYVHCSMFIKNPSVLSVSNYAVRCIICARIYLTNNGCCAQNTKWPQYPRNWALKNWLCILWKRVGNNRSNKWEWTNKKAEFWNWKSGERQLFGSNTWHNSETKGRHHFFSSRTTALRERGGG